MAEPALLARLFAALCFLLHKYGTRRILYMVFSKNRKFYW
jgi:hypothetical protein